MGYCITQRDCSFKIKKENIEAAYLATKNMPDQRYSWVSETWKRDCHSLSEVLEEWRYMPEFDDETGDIIGLQFEGEKLGQEDALFTTIAPFVEPNSFIEMDGEDGSMWRWVFQDNQCLEISPTITW